MVSIKKSREFFGNEPVTFLSWLSDLIPVTRHHRPPQPQFLDGFQFVILDIFSVIPGTDCLYRGFEFSLVGNTLGFLALHIGFLAMWWRQRWKGNPYAWRTLKWLGVLSNQVAAESTARSRPA